MCMCVYMCVCVCVCVCVLIYLSLQVFPGGSDGKESACNAGDLGSIHGLGRSPGKGHGHPLQYSFLENPHGQRSLAGSWSHKESDITEQLSRAQQHISLHFQYV